MVGQRPAARASREQIFKIAKYISMHIWNAPDMIHACVYDNAPCHRKKAEDALNTHKMRKGQGKACKSVPHMRDTEWTDIRGRKGQRGKVYKQKMAVNKNRCPKNLGAEGGAASGLRTGDVGH